MNRGAFSQNGEPSKAEAELAIRHPKPCRSYGAGHAVHHIQCFKGLRDAESKLNGRVVEINDREIVLSVEDELLRFYNHDLDRARDLLAVKGPEVEVQTRWSLLWFDTYLVSARAINRGPLEECPLDGPTQGGFLFRPGDED